MSQNNSSSNHENCGFTHNPVTYTSSACRSTIEHFSNSVVPNMSKGDTSTKSKDLSAGHSGPVIIKAHNMKNRVPLSSLANVSCKKEGNSWMANATVYRSDSTAKPDGVQLVELDRPSASDSVEFALQSLFHSDTSMLVTPTQNPKLMSVESVEKILKSPSPESDDDDLSIVFDSYASQTVPGDSKPLGKPVAEPSNVKVLILRKKTGDNVKSGVKVSPAKCSINGKSVESGEKNEWNSVNRILPETSSSLTMAIANGTNQGISPKAVYNIKIQRPPNKMGDKKYVQVENELEKMFAGIDDSDPSATQLNSSPTTNSSQLPRKNKNSSVPAKTNKKNSKPAAVKGVKNKNSSSSKEALDPLKKIPMIHIEGSKENPIHAHIVNSMKSEDEELSNGRMSVKRKLANDPAVKTTTLNFAFKNHDSASSDSTWVCVFCNLSANVQGLAGEATGDLFGPYFIRMPDQVNSDESKIHSWRTAHPEQVMKKHKGSPADLPPSDEQKSVEIWAHENCIVWASGVHLIGSKLIGLEEAVMQALETTCAHCHNRGATIGCRARNCNSCAHCSCALHTGWKLDTETFISTCSAHSAPPNA